MNDVYVDDAYPSVTFPLNVFVPLQMLLVVVPNASERVLSAVKSPPPCIGYVVEMRRAFVTGVKPKIEDEAAMISSPVPPAV